MLLGREAPGNAGSYAPISVACKPLVLASFVLAGFLLPEAASRRHAGQHALRQLGVVLAVIAVPAVALIALSGAAPSTVLRIAFGPRLTAAAPAFLMLALAMTLLAATVLFTHYLLAAGRPVVLLVLAIGAGLTVILLLERARRTGGDGPGRSHRTGDRDGGHRSTCTSHRASAQTFKVCGIASGSRRPAAEIGAAARP